MMVRYWRCLVINKKQQDDFDMLENLAYDPSKDTMLMKS
jgi:hypothetical protein